MTTNSRSPLVVDVGPLRETHYTGIPNVVAELCSRLLREEWLELYFDLDGRWIDNDSMRQCLDERSGVSLTRDLDRFRPESAIRAELRASGSMHRSVALYMDHRPPRKVYPREGKLVYDLSMILAPECHPPESVKLYTSDLEQQIACSDLLFCISESTARDLEWIFGVARARLRVALLGSNLDLTWSQRIRELIGDRPTEPFLLVLGSIEPRKNAALMLEWVVRHPEVLEQVRIVFAGRQAWGDSFASLIDSKSLQGAMASGRMVFTGYADEKLKTALLVGAAALVYPSLFEGFGLPLLEAMAVGTPVLASASTSMPEVVGDCGYYFDPCSVDSLHSAFVRFWADKQSGRVAELVRRGKQRASAFSYDTTYRIIIEGLFPHIHPAGAAQDRTDRRG
jgi:glycosyltransferase involved in cell wall biosynthesis